MRGLGVLDRPDAAAGAFEMGGDFLECGVTATGADGGTGWLGAVGAGTGSRV